MVHVTSKVVLPGLDMSEICAYHDQIQLVFLLNKWLKKISIGNIIKITIIILTDKILNFDEKSQWILLFLRLNYLINLLQIKKLNLKYLKFNFQGA